MKVRSSNFTPTAITIVNLLSLWSMQGIEWRKQIIALADVQKELDTARETDQYSESYLDYVTQKNVTDKIRKHMDFLENKISSMMEKAYDTPMKDVNGTFMRLEKSSSAKVKGLFKHPGTNVDAPYHPFDPIGGAEQVHHHNTRVEQNYVNLEVDDNYFEYPTEMRITSLFPIDDIDISTDMQFVSVVQNFINGQYFHLTSLWISSIEMATAEMMATLAREGVKQIIGLKTTEFTAKMSAHLEDVFDELELAREIIRFNQIELSDIEAE